VPRQTSNNKTATINTNNYDNQMIKLQTIGIGIVRFNIPINTL